jgi:hypothetical protein
LGLIKGGTVASDYITRALENSRLTVANVNSDGTLVSKHENDKDEDALTLEINSRKERLETIMKNNPLSGFVSKTIT